MLLVQFFVASEDISGHPQPPASVGAGRMRCCASLSRQRHNSTWQEGAAPILTLKWVLVAGDGCGGRGWMTGTKTRGWVRSTSFQCHKEGHQVVQVPSVLK